MIFVMGEGILIFLAVSLASFLIIAKGMGMTAILEIIWPKVLLISVVSLLSLYFQRKNTHVS